MNTAASDASEEPGTKTAASGDTQEPATKTKTESTQEPSTDTATDSSQSPAADTPVRKPQPSTGSKTDGTKAGTTVKQPGAAKSITAHVKDAVAKATDSKKAGEPAK